VVSILRKQNVSNHTSLKKGKIMSLLRKNMLTYLMPIVTASLLAILFVIAVYRYSTQMHTITNDMIVDHVEELADILKKIDKECQIIGFQYEKNYIDFLNVAKFDGSEVGSMNLAYPSEWKGPYLKDNPTIQEKQYVVVVAKTGYYVAPADGVVLANGKVIGKDIIINKDTDFDALMRDPELLLYNKQPMARKFKEV
jgi:hypothetical protein